MSVSTRLTKMSPSSISRKRASVFVMPSMFDFVVSEWSISTPAKMSWIFPTP